MNPLYLSGFGVSLKVDAARLVVKDGFLEPDSTQKEEVSSIIALFHVDVDNFRAD